MSNTTLGFCSIAVALIVTGSAGAQGWTEIGDAGEFPAESGQEVVGSGALLTITGATDTAASDFVDAYVIRIVDASSFYATTSSAWDPAASAGWDTRLYLFDVDGVPVIANDDTPGVGGTQSLISDPGIFPGVVDPTAAPLTNGTYVLVISGWANDPEDIADIDLFDLDSDFDALFGPDPAAGSFDHWENGHGLVMSGSYTIALQGAGFITTGDCPADLNGDLVVDVLDLLALFAAWGDCPGCDEDLNGDDVVDVLDLLDLFAAWGPCP